VTSEQKNGILVWNRQDLRVTNYAPLAQPVAEGAEVLVLYCFDDQAFGSTSAGFAKTGAFVALPKTQDS
jgi:deoxyribodipyrimidine photo-lyase